MDKTSCKKKIAGLAEDYFDYISRNYPVMCLSDEFYFFPRAKKAREHLSSLESLNKEKIKQDISFVKNLQARLRKLNIKDTDIEAEIDFTLLSQTISTFLREFGETRIWQVNPILYLKIILFGIEHVIGQSYFLRSDTEGCLLSRIKQVPRLLNEAKSNLRNIPQGYLKTAIEAAESSTGYFKNLSCTRLKSSRLTELTGSINKTLDSLSDFKKALRKKVSSRDFFIKDKTLLRQILRHSFSYKRGLDDIFRIASEELRNTRKELAETAGRINPKKSWQEILYQYDINLQEPKELLNLYVVQAEKIKKFLKGKSIMTIPKTQKVIIKETPSYLRPLRASASYACPVTGNRREPAFFYITPDFGKPARSKKKFYSSVHNEYIFVTAHETYPGHHLLDSIRRSLKNPLRQQLESPLFYEGWASYSERLIKESGYINAPEQKIVGLRRQAWRAVRAMLDVGIRINKFKLTDAESALKNLGYNPSIVKSMLRHYLLTPGYQLCYTIGKFELERLQKKFVPKTGLKDFHDNVLSSGQIPFYLLEKRLEGSLCRKNS